MWPTPQTASKRFYDENLKSAVDLLASQVADRRSRSSGRPPRPSQAEWRAVVVLALAALETGLEDVLLVAHHQRITSVAVGVGATELEAARGRLLKSLSLSAPDAQKIENTVLAHFGVLPSQISIPAVAQFTTRRKPHAWEGTGTDIPFSGDWRELATRLDAIQYFRNAVAHADSTKLKKVPQSVRSLPTGAQGSVCALKKDGTWSLQMPHAVTAVRTTVAVYNVVADALASVVNPGKPPQFGLRSPDEVVPV